MRSHLPLLLLLLLFLLFHVIFWQPVSPWWDEAVYVGIGQYFASFGELGLYESIRPPVWPLLLGVIWTLGLDPLLLGRWLVLLFFLGILILTYALGLHFFTKTAGLLAAALLAFSPTMFFFSYHALSSIPAVFFALLGMLLFVRQRYYTSGLFFSLSFLTRFPQGLLFLLPFFLGRPFLRFVLGFFTPVLPYLGLMQSMQGSFWQHFLLASKVVNEAGIWLYTQPWYFYLLQLLKESPLYIFVLFTKHSKKLLPLLLPALGFLIYFSFVPHKEARFLIIFLPFFALLAAGAIIRLFKQKLLRLFLLLFIVGFFYATYQPEPLTSLPLEFYHFPASSIISTSPYPVLYQSIPLYPAYYPIFDQGVAEASYRLFQDSSFWEAYFYESCAVPCPPEDAACEGAKKKLEHMLASNIEVYNQDAHNCQQAVYTKSWFISPHQAYIEYVYGN